MTTATRTTVERSMIPSDLIEWHGSPLTGTIDGMAASVHADGLVEVDGHPLDDPGHVWNWHVGARGVTPHAGHSPNGVTGRTADTWHVACSCGDTVYVGTARAPFADRVARDIIAQVRRLRADTSPFAGNVRPVLRAAITAGVLGADVDVEQWASTVGRTWTPESLRSHLFGSRA